MDFNTVKIGHAVRSKDASVSKDRNKRIGGTEARSQVDFCVKVGDVIEKVYAAMNKQRLETHVIPSAAMSLNTTRNSQVVAIAILTINPNDVTKNGLRYVLNGINNTDAQIPMRFYLTKSLAFDLEIWAAIKTLGLTNHQGQFRWNLLNKISTAVPNPGILIMANMLYHADSGVYQRVITRSAECLIDGTIDAVTGQHLLEGLSKVPYLRQDLEECIQRKKAMMNKVAAARERENRRHNAGWKLANGLRTISEKEVEAKLGFRRD